MSKFSSKLQVGILSSLLFICVISATTSNASAMGAFSEQLAAEQQQAISKSSASLAVIENPELVVRVLDNLIRNVIYSLNVDIQAGQTAQKRGLDLGMTRGFSGSQAGKHLMGLSAASFANGPGRR